MIKQESVLTVLMVLFMHHSDDGQPLLSSEDGIFNKLEEFGFAKNTISQALNWLAHLEVQTLASLDPPSENAIRVFSDYENTLIDAECQGLIQTLEQLGILSPTSREMVIHQLMMLANEEIDVSLVKWVTLIVLFSLPKQEQALAQMEFLVLDSTVGGIQ